MGLDMYLYRKTYVENWSFQKPEEKHEITVKKGGETRTDIDPNKISFIVEKVGYWRKFNALHGWFVDNLADGKDECQEIFVMIDDLKNVLGVLKEVHSVLNDCPKVVKEEVDAITNETYENSYYECSDKINELLPPRGGFFFGSTDIDDYFKRDVEESITMLEDIIGKHNDNRFDITYYYQASW